MTQHKHRLENQQAFILHSYPFRETSLLLEVFSRDHGRLAIVARGARRSRSALRGVLMNFQPLEISWFGKGEVRTLHSAEWLGGQPQLQGTALLCGFYLNELLINLTARDDPHERLFDYYRQTMQLLARESDHAAILRCFEKHLLQELGYALSLEREADTGKPIDAAAEYQYVIERGAISESMNEPGGMRIAGKTLLDMAADDYRDPATARQGKQLMRMLLNHYLAGRAMHTRELIKDLQKS
jgi:DNA repair protein RecO (recombination protein O)